MGGRANTNASQVSGGNLAVAIDESVPGTTYLGYAATGTPTSLATWKICKVVLATGVTTITWANGNTDYVNVWDDRAVLTYF